MVYKSLNNLAPEYMTNMFTYIQDFHQRKTISSVRKDLVEDIRTCLLVILPVTGLCCGTIYTLILGTVVL